LKFQKDIILFLPDSILKQMENCVEKAYPNEACGLAFGKREQINNPNEKNDFLYYFNIERFNCIDSDKKSPIAFLIENIEKLNQIYHEAHQKFNMKFISIFHSHPSGNHPSGADRENMERLQNSGLKSFQFIIWSIMDAENKDLKGFIFLNNEINQVEVKIKNSK